MTRSRVVVRGMRSCCLVPHGITAARAVKLYREYGNKTMEIVKEHPYRLCEMAGIGFATADKIALNMGFDSDEFPSYAPNEFGEISHTEFTLSEPDESTKLAEVTPMPAPKKELTEEEKIKLAKNLPCPNGKYTGKTLGDLICLDPKYLVWLVNK